MNFRKLSGSIACLTALFLCLSFQVRADGVVPPGTNQLAEVPSPYGSYAEWWIESDYTTTGAFTVGGSWNTLTIDDGYTFESSGDMTVGPTGGTMLNSLNVEANSTVVVNGNLYCGYLWASQNRVKVSGSGARLEVTGSLQVGNGSGLNTINNYLTVDDGGIVVVDSDKDGTGNLGFYNYWAYGNSWLELGDGLVSIWGDQTASYASGQSLLTSIKVWDDITGAFQRVAEFDNQSVVMTDYFDLLSVNYITDSAMASSLGLSSEFVGFTVLQTGAMAEVPEPTTALLLALGLAGAFLLRKKS